jgi:hypothetical protein
MALHRSDQPILKIAAMKGNAQMSTSVPLTILSSRWDDGRDFTMVKKNANTKRQVMHVEGFISKTDGGVCMRIF